MADSTEEWQRFLPDSQTSNSASEFSRAYNGKTVFVSGAGGYIGSGLATALASASLQSLVLLDASEHALFEIRRNMKTANPATTCHYILGSVGDQRLLSDVVCRFRPQIVFHAAAFKHVELLEHNAAAAIENNVLGTYTLLRAALDKCVAKFVLLSTDKAVNPHSVMGVSKRVAELITTSHSSQAFRANAIRLGNVIGSWGSVVPLFLEQIAGGGSISVTHPQASRYFLSKGQAVTAILAAGAADCEGKILIPELGPPVLIADLAGFLLKTLNGSHASQLSFTGLRPGEKLTEDLLAGNETAIGTADGPLTIVKTSRLSLNECEQAINKLSTFVVHRDHPALIQFLSKLVPEYVPSKHLQERAGLLAQGAG